MENLSENIKKNILDLEYNKLLQYYNTCIIILFTYFIGLISAFFSKQINFFIFKQFISISTISIIFVLLMFIAIMKFRNSMRRVISQIKKLNI